jgi:hypothetical protein
MEKQPGDSRLYRFLFWLLWKVEGGLYKLGVWIFKSKK